MDSDETKTKTKIYVDKWPESMQTSRILVVDDLSFYVSFVVQTLRNHGFTGTIDTVSNLNKALAKITDAIKANAVYQMVITDLYLPDGLGINLVEKLRENKHSANIAIVLITTENESSMIIKAFQIGIDNYAIKPTTEEDLYERLKFAWNKRNK
jgi:DNA-binding response OmpR family regulator